MSRMGGPRDGSLAGGTKPQIAPHDVREYRRLHCHALSLYRHFALPNLDIGKRGTVDYNIFAIARLHFLSSSDRCIGSIDDI